MSEFDLETKNPQKGLMIIMSNGSLIGSIMDMAIILIGRMFTLAI